MYTYCVGNPIGYTDPSGHWIWGVVGAVMGAYDGYMYAKKKKLSGWKMAAAIVGGAALSAINPFKVVKAASKVVKVAKFTKKAKSGFSKLKAAKRILKKPKLPKVKIKKCKPKVKRPKAKRVKKAKVKECKKIGKERLKPTTNTGKAQTLKEERVHGNNKSSTKPQHGYEIFNKSDGDVVKTGISGQPLNKNGTSPRANRQVNQLNKIAGEEKYGARVVITNMPDRRTALQWEIDNSLKLWQEGNSMCKHLRPRPWEKIK